MTKLQGSGPATERVLAPEPYSLANTFWALSLAPRLSSGDGLFRIHQAITVQVVFTRITQVIRSFAKPHSDFVIDHTVAVGIANTGANDQGRSARHMGAGH